VGFTHQDESRDERKLPRDPSGRGESSMSTNPLGTYTFLPWLRHGVANRITGPATTQRATINVALQIETTPKSGSTTSATQVSRAVELYGPGDIIGIDQAQISRVEPPAWVTNFETNYLAAIEFYDEDF